jgi:hypothetical protein
MAYFQPFSNVISIKMSCAARKNPYNMTATVGDVMCKCSSVSSRISKWQGYPGFFRKRAGSSFGQKGQFASYKEKLEKRTEFHSF